MMVYCDALSSRTFSCSMKQDNSSVVCNVFGSFRSQHARKHCDMFFLHVYNSGTLGLILDVQLKPKLCAKIFAYLL